MGGGVRNYYVDVIFALSNAEFDNGRGRGSRNKQKGDYVICEQSLSNFTIKNNVAENHLGKGGAVGER